MSTVSELAKSVVARWPQVSSAQDPEACQEGIHMYAVELLTHLVYYGMGCMMQLEREMVNEKFVFVDYLQVLKSPQLRQRGSPVFTSIRVLIPRKAKGATSLVSVGEYKGMLW